MYEIRIYKRSNFWNGNMLLCVIKEKDTDRMETILIEMRKRFPKEEGWEVDVDWK